MNMINKEEVEKLTWEDYEYKDVLNAMTALREEIRKLPIIQIIQCKNCKHWHKEMSRDGTVEYTNYSRCLLGNNGDGRNWFCPEGEIKE